MIISRSKIFLGLVVLWAIALGIYFGMPPLEAKLLAGTPSLFDYVTWQEGAASGWGLYRILWVIGDWTEGTVSKALFGSVGLFIGGYIAYVLWKKNSPKMGNPICADLGVFPWVILAAFTGMFVSTLLYANNLVDGWVPTFLPGCTIPAAIVFMFGGGKKVALTAGVLSGIIQFPMGMIGIKLATLLGAPGISGNAIFGMCIAGIIIIEIFKELPWIRPIVKANKEAKAEAERIAAENPPEPLNAGEETPLPPTIGTGVKWMGRRTLADFTEIYFLGNEYAGLGLVLGVLLSWFLNPLHTGYGGPNFTSAILAGQIMGVSLGIFVHYGHWQKYGWYNTFTASIAQGALVLTFGPSLSVIVIGAVMSATLCPFLAFYFASKFNRYQGVIGGTFGMGIAIAIEAGILGSLLLMLPK